MSCHYPHPPQLFSVVEKDVAEPTNEEIDKALRISRKYWFNLASLAHVQRVNGLSADDIDPHYGLRKIPKFHARPKTVAYRPSEFSPTYSYFFEASSTWKVSNETACDGARKEVSRYALLQLGLVEPVTVELDGDVFSSWPGTTEEASHDSNYLGVLTLGWCYILSAYLVELRGDDALMRYTPVKAGYNDDSIQGSPGTNTIDIGKVDDDVARWWAAILGPGEGWQAFVARQPRDIIAPWSTQRGSEISESFSIKCESNELNPNPSPLCSKGAFEALAEFAHSYKLGSQFSIALATALTIPIHGHHSSTARLPATKTMSGTKPASSVEAVPPFWLRLFDELPYYLTLSCSPDLMMSTFCGSLWEPGVPCNMVTPWLYPVLNEVLGGLPIESGRDQEIIALMCAVRRPSISALWIGAVISGLGSKILRGVRGGSPPLDPNGFSWTGAPQSFMDIPGSGPYMCRNPEYMQRQDIWRLLHLPTDEMDDLGFGHRPFTPWAPCGASLVKNCALRVNSHLTCRRHEYHYDHWNWELEDGTVIKDHGFITKHPTFKAEARCDLSTVVHSTKFQDKELDYNVQEASRRATWDIFHWFFINGEYLPVEEIYHDTWIKEIWENNSDLNPDEPLSEKPEIKKSDSEIRDQVKLWLDTLIFQPLCSDYS
ncbi:hypothetical protein N7540_007001 [Penicillium herquei]|nr:hypothetical protein N7540_007001 [Penicillium herquei]